MVPQVAFTKTLHRAGMQARRGNLIEVPWSTATDEEMAGNVAWADASMGILVVDLVDSLAESLADSRIVELKALARKDVIVCSDVLDWDGARTAFVVGERRFAANWQAGASVKQAARHVATPRPQASDDISSCHPFAVAMITTRDQTMDRNIIRKFEPAMEDLRARFQDRLIVRGDESYDHARQVWNRAADRHPLAIAFCEGAEDVQAVVRTARAHDMPVSVRGGGHEAFGRSVRSDALVLDLSRMNKVEVDGHSATVGGGTPASKLIAAAAESNLMAVTGWHSTPGITGLATVGGYGPLIARHGLALDNVVGAELVLANGQRIIANRDKNSDLLWAIQGGGGNFGVITSLRLRLHPARQVLSGTILFPWSEAATVLGRYVTAMASASTNLTVATGIISLPDGDPALILAPAWTGETSEGEIAMEVLKRLGRPMHAQISLMSYQDLVASFDARIAHDKNYAFETRSVPALDKETISALIAGGESRTSPLSTIILQHFRGLPTQLPPDSTAFGLRREHIMVELIATWESTAGDDGSVHERWARDLSRNLAPMSLPGGYPNLLPPHAEDQIAEAFGHNITRLRAVKRRYDPDGVFSATPLAV